MAEFLTGSASSAQIVLASIDLFLVADAIRTIDFDIAISEAGPTFSTRVRIDGTILCSGFSAIVLQSDGIAADRLVIGTEGQVHAFGAAAIRMSGANARFINDGQVSGDTGAVISNGIFSTVTNTGSLTGTALNGAGLSCLSGMSFTQITNAGNIAGYNGIRVAGSYVDITNTGMIHACFGRMYHPELRRHRGTEWRCHWRRRE
jgi:hypothetical protein